MDKPKRPPGRPPTPPEEALVLRSLRMKPRQWAKVDAHGVAWLRALIDRSKPPKTLE
jgi:hypothetical protein